MTLIVDASVALKWYFDDEDHTAEARDLLVSGDRLIAPDIVIAEVCNSAWRGVRTNRIRREQADSIARSVAEMFDPLVGSAGLASRALAIACQLDHAVYDCLYLALSEARDCPVMTADARLLGKITNSPWAARVHCLGGDPP